MDMQFSFQGIGFLIIALFFYISFKRRSIKWLYPVGIMLFILIFWSPVKFTSPDRSAIEAVHQDFTIEPKVEVPTQTVEEAQHELIRKSK